MNKKRIVFVIALFMFLTHFVIGQDVDYSGTSTANFLKIPMGARQTAMGDAATAIVEDASAMYWNVGAISRLPNDISVNISSMNWLVDTRISYLSAVLKAGNIGSFGIDLQYLDYGNIEETTIYDQDGTGRFFSASDLAVGLGFARFLTENFSFGFKLKYIYEELANANADAFGFDVGAVFRTTFFDNNFRIAMALSNFGSKMKFNGRDLAVVYSVPGSPANKQIPAELSTIEWEIPLLFRFGVSNYFIKNEQFSVLAAYDILDSRDYEVRHNIGTELGYRNIFFLRGGYKINYDQVNYTAGFGVNLSSMIGYNLHLDYVFLDYGIFEPLHQFSFNINL